MEPAEAEARLAAILEQVRAETNARLPSFSRLHALIIHPEPFEKTPTNKIKRHLYYATGTIKKSPGVCRGFFLPV